MSMKKLVITFISSTILICVIFSLTLFSFTTYTDKYYDDSENKKNGVIKRRFPYPYKAAVSICSDIDATDSVQEFLTIQEFMNTENLTEAGTGINLEIGNSFFPVADNGQFALISKNPHDMEVIIDLIKTGHIDFIHSFNTAKNRSEILTILETLKKNNCDVDVWVNHARVPNDVGPNKWCLGDNPLSGHYHTDISIGDEDGIRFVSIGAVSSILGQGVPLTFRSFFLALDDTHFVKSLYNNVVKEIAKYFLSHVDKKYGYRKNNELIYPIALGDGKSVYGFVRNNSSYKGIRGGSTIDGLSDILTKKNLNSLINVEGTIIIYTHFGQNNGPPYIDERTSGALRLLSEAFYQGNIYVTTTSKLLNYYTNNKYLEWRVISKQSGIEIHIDRIADPIRGNYTPNMEDIQGVSFETKDLKNTRLFLAGNEIHNLKRYYGDSRNSGVIMISVNPLPEVSQLFQKYRKNGFFN